MAHKNLSSFIFVSQRSCRSFRLGHRLAERQVQFVPAFVMLLSEVALFRRTRSSIDRLKLRRYVWTRSERSSPTVGEPIFRFTRVLRSDCEVKDVTPVATWSQRDFPVTNRQASRRSGTRSMISSTPSIRLPLQVKAMKKWFASSFSTSLTALMNCGESSNRSHRR